MSFSSDAPLQSNQLSLDVEFQKEKPEFNDILTLAYRRAVDAINTKEGGLYLLGEIATFKQVYNLNPPSGVYSQSVNRNLYRKTWDLIEENGGVNIPNGNSVNVAHNITGLKDGFLIYATITTDDAGNPRYTITGPSTNPDVYLTDTNIVFNNNTGFNVTQGIFVAEYTKN